MSSRKWLLWIAALLMVIMLGGHRHFAPLAFSHCHPEHGSIQGGGLPWQEYQPDRLQDANLIFFSSTYCIYCKVFLNDAKDPDLRNALSRYQLFHVDGERQADFKKRLDVRGFPSFVIVDRRGKVLSKKSGYTSKAAMIAFLDNVRPVADFLKIAGQRELTAEEMFSLLNAAVYEDAGAVFVSWAKKLKQAHPDVFKENEQELLPQLFAYQHLAPESTEVQAYLDTYGYCSDSAWAIRGEPQQEKWAAKNHSGPGGYLEKIYAPYLDCQDVSLLAIAYAKNDILTYSMSEPFEERVIALLQDSSNRLSRQADQWLAEIYYKRKDFALARQYAENSIPGVTKGQQLDQLMQQVQALDWTLPKKKK